MNITKGEYDIIRDRLADEEHPEDVAPEVWPPQPPAHLNMVPVYQWKYIDGRDGTVARTSRVLYLNRDNCVQDGVSTGQDIPDYCEMKVDVFQVLANRTEVFLHKVYQHLLYQEFEARIKQHCHGCFNNCNSQENHMGGAGCLDETEVLVELHGHACHLRISEMRLYEAAREVMDTFNKSGINLAHAKDCIQSATPKQILSGRENYLPYFEFEKLNKL